MFSSAILLIAGIYFGSYKLFRVDNEGLTATITATTETLSFSLQEDRHSAWNLPAGKFFVASDRSPNDDCEQETRIVGGISMVVGYTCQYESTRRLEIYGAANIAVSLTPAGNLRLSVKPHESDDLNIQLMDEQNRPLIETHQELSYETDMPGGPLRPERNYQVRIPLIATTAQVGEHLHYVSTTSGGPEDFWQPALLSGNVSIIAQNLPDSEKFDVLSESLDAGDVLGIGIDLEDPDYNAEDASTRRSTDNTEDADVDLVWGVATIGYQQATMSGTTEVAQFLIHVVMHTTHRKLSVRRFGTKDGHTIKASQWTIISKWPNGQKAWISFMSLVVILTFVLQLGDVFNANPLKKKKKGKQNKKRKRKGD